MFFVFLKSLTLLYTYTTLNWELVLNVFKLRHLNQTLWLMNYFFKLRKVINYAAKFKNTDFTRQTKIKEQFKQIHNMYFDKLKLKKKTSIYFI